MAKREFSPEDVGTWISAVKRDLDRLSKKLSPLLDERERLKRQLDLLERLHETVERSEDGSPKILSAWSPSPGSVRDYVIEKAVEVLEEEGGPLHINEIHARFLAKGFEVPGAGSPANITVHIRQFPGIATTKRGIYILAKYLET